MNPCPVLKLATISLLVLCYSFFCFGQIEQNRQLNGADALIDEKYSELAKKIFNSISTNNKSIVTNIQNKLEEFEIEKDELVYVLILNHLSELLLSSLESENARQLLQHALNLTYNDNKLNLYNKAITYGSLGSYFQLINKYDSATHVLKSSLKIYKENFSDNHVEISNISKKLGDIYGYGIYDHQSALEYYRCALELLSIDQYPLNATLIYIGMAKSYFLNKNLMESEAFAKKSQQILDAYSINDLKSYAEIFDILGIILFQKYYNDELQKSEKLQNAIQYIKQAISILNKEDKSSYSLFGKYYNNMGYVYQVLAMSDSAIFSYKTALKFNFLTPNNLLNQSNGYLNIGEFYQQQGEIDSAKQYFNKCLDIRLKLYGAKHSETSVVFLHLAELFSSVDQLDTALVYYQKALIAHIDEFNNDDIYSLPKNLPTDQSFNYFFLLTEKAGTLVEKYNKDPKYIRNLTAALDTYNLADSALTHIFNLFVWNKSKLNLLNSFHFIYEDAIDCVYRLFTITNDRKYLNLAIKFIERNKSVILLQDLMRSSRFKQLLPDSIRATIKRNQTTIDSLNTVLGKVKQALADSNNKINKTDSMLTSHSIRQIELYRLLDDRYPNFAMTNLKSERYDLAQITAILKKSNAILIEYFWSEEYIYIINLSYKGNVKFLRLDNTDQLGNSINQFRELIVSGIKLRKLSDQFNEYGEYAYKVFNQIVAPVLDINIAEKEAVNLIIIPDGPLHLLPFDALIYETPTGNILNYKNLKYLIMKYQISYASSIKFILNRRTSKLKIKDDYSIAAFGYSNKDKYLNNGLPGTMLEINVLESLSPNKFYNGINASIQDFLDKAPSYNILHLGVHGQADSISSYNNRLIFRNPNNPIEDDTLYSYQIRNLDLNAVLTVLSACETGIGRNYKGEGVFSIARDFLMAGSSSVIMSLWKIGDISSSEIITFFYGHLLAGSDIDQSLRLAKLQYLEKSDEYSAHPYFWASFIPIGKMEHIETPYRRGELYYGALFSIIIFSLIIYWIRQRNY